MLYIYYPTNSNNTMEEIVHCVVHYKRAAEYVCPACKNLPLCNACMQEHKSEAGHAPENYKKVGESLMRWCIQDADETYVEGLTKELREGANELGASLLREIDRFQSSFVQAAEQCGKVCKLYEEKRYVELYFYAKSHPVNGSGSKTEAMRGLIDRLLKMLDTASSGLKEVLVKIHAMRIAHHKPIFSTYKKDEVFVFEPNSTDQEEKSALHSADMSKCKAVYIDHCAILGDCVASELASCLQAHPISALYLSSNDISDAGAEVLARAAFRGKSLSAFCLEGIQISDTGAKAVAEAIRSCHSLTTFYF
ncbi:MAG: hypothetical protein P4L51_14145, partial [Puia sp.]|nr:hypothetical protein [Puia sp.]